MENLIYLGIDFGTANSHFAYSNGAVSGRVKSKEIFFGKKSSIPTCVQWQIPAKCKEHIFSFGNRAYQNFSRPKFFAEQKYIWAFNFKPNLSTSETACFHAWAFFTKVSEHLSEPGKIQLPEAAREPKNRFVVIGVPAEIGDKHRELTIKAVKESGLGTEVECVEEPLGALAFYLNKFDNQDRSLISSEDIRNGVVVVDFGGGTLDMAFLNSDRLTKCWGNPSLGGRLFDDLFYQWFMESSEGKIKRDDNKEYDDLVIEKRFWYQDCRDAKEAFSRAWMQALFDEDDFDYYTALGIWRDDRHSTTLSIENCLPDEFLKKARSYSPSSMLRQHYNSLSAEIPDFLDTNKPINLLEEIRKAVQYPIEYSDDLRNRTSKVLLTGGSCDWPFMRELVAEALDLELEKVINPEGEAGIAIGSGLSIYMPLQITFNKRKAYLTEQLPRYDKEIQKDIDKEIDKFADTLATVLAAKIHPKTKEIVKNWYENGGSLIDVERNITEEFDRFSKSNDIDEVTNKHFKNLDKKLGALVRKYLSKFLADNDIPREVDLYTPESATLQDIQNINFSGLDRLPKGAGEVVGVAAFVGVMGSVVGAIILVIKSHLYIALIVANPIIGSIIAILGLILSGFAADSTGKWTEKRLKSYNFQGRTLWLIKNTPVIGLNEEKLQSALNEGKEQTKNELKRGILSVKDESEEVLATDKIKSFTLNVFHNAVNRVIQDLGVFDSFGE